MTTLKTGGDIDAYCTKCHLLLAHVVVAMAHGRVARVQCKTCGSTHAYRSERPERRSSGPAERSPRVKGATRSQYDDLIAGRDISRAQRYQPSRTYGEGDVMSHPTFGLGLVTRALSDDKVEVLFPAGAKVLVHARG